MNQGSSRRRSTTTAYNWSQASAAARRRRRPRRTKYKGKQKVKTNKQLTLAVKKLWKGRAIKQHYVQDTTTTSIGAPSVIELTGIGAGETSNTHEGNKIQLRGLDVHGYVRVTNSGGVPSVSHPTRWNVMIVRTTLDVGISGVPSYSNLFDQTNLPATMADFDGFRQLNSEELIKQKIIYKKEFTLSPQSYDATSGYNSPYPGFKKWSINLKLGNAMIEYRQGSSTAINAQYYIMLKSDSTGAAGNLGLEHSFISKLTFYDVE